MTKKGWENMNLEVLKIKNNQYLSSLGIGINQNLPLIEDLQEVQPRSAQDVAGRLSAIAYVIGLAFGANRIDLIDNLKKFKLWDYVSNYEKSLLQSDEISEQDKINMEWLSESAQALAWSINIVELDHFKHCDDDLATKIPFNNDPTNFIASARLRPIEEIQEQSDLLYRMHWYTRNCKLTDTNCVLSESTIVERRKAIDWAYGVEEDWDEVPLDT